MINEAVPLKAHAPIGRVELTGGPLQTALENNIG